MPRKPRPLDRDGGAVRDASLVVIASEDTHAVQCYFARFQPRRVQFRVLPSQDGLSAPEFILARLRAFTIEFDIGGDDQLWYCGDTDHWAQPNHIANLVRVLQDCKQAGYHVALSNPCFELWLLLHFCDVANHALSCEDVCDKLSAQAGGYSKTRGCHAPISAEMVQKAAERAAQLDAGTPEIPNTPTSRIYRILNLLIQRESIVVK